MDSHHVEIPPIFKLQYRPSDKTPPHHWSHHQMTGATVNNSQGELWYGRWHDYMSQQVVHRIEASKGINHVQCLNLDAQTRDTAGRPTRTEARRPTSNLGTPLDALPHPDYATSMFDAHADRRPPKTFNCPEESCSKDFSNMTATDIERHHQEHVGPDGEKTTPFIEKSYDRIIVLFREDDRFAKADPVQRRLEVVKHKIADLQRLFTVPFPAPASQVVIVGERISGLDVPTFWQDSEKEKDLARDTFLFRNFDEKASFVERRCNGELWTRTILGELRVCQELGLKPLIVSFGIDGFSSNWKRMSEFFTQLDQQCEDLDIDFAIIVSQWNAGSKESDPPIRHICPFPAGQHWLGVYRMTDLAAYAANKSVEEDVDGKGIETWERLTRMRGKSDLDERRIGFLTTGR